MVGGGPFGLKAGQWTDDTSMVGLITPHQKKMFFMDIGRLGYRKSEPNEPPAESPEAIAKMIRFHQRKLHYTDTDVATLLHLIPSEFSRLYNETLSKIPITSIAPRLRLIN
jgi:AraC-like DNA-binding protein